MKKGVRKIEKKVQFSKYLTSRNVILGDMGCVLQIQVQRFLKI